jgi:AAA domain
MMNLIVLHGPAAVGKLTVARELAALTGFRLFHNHLVVDALLAVFDFGSAPFVRLREDMWLAVFREAAENGQSLIFTYCPESTVRETFIPTMRDAVVAAAGGNVIFVKLTCSAGDEVLEQRLDTPERAAFHKLRAVDEYRALRAQGAFDVPDLPDSGLTIDTAAYSPAAAARLIQSRFKL